MLLSSPQYSKIDVLMKRITIGVIFFIATAFLVTGGSLFKDSSAELVDRLGSSVILEKHNLHQNLDNIGSGALALHPKKQATLIPDLSRDLVFLAQTSRPDRKPAEGDLLIATRGSQDSLVIPLGQQVFLKREDRENGEILYHFSSLKTPLWIRPLSSRNGEIQMEVGCFSSSKDNESFVEELTQVLMQQSNSTISDKNNEPLYLSSLRSAKWWGNDTLLKKYGGQDYKSLSDKHKLEILSESGRQYYFFAVGDFLQWEDGFWTEVDFPMTNPSCPLAQIKTAQGNVLEIQVWDEKGFYPCNIKIDLQSPVKISHKNQLSSSTVRLRSATQVSCAFGKRRLILKEGDWLLKTAKSWRTLRRIKDIEDCIYHRLKGELFIFDRMEKLQGTLVMKGHLFDDMRTSMTPLSIPILSEEGGRPSSKKNTHNSSTQKKKGGPLRHEK